MPANSRNVATARTLAKAWTVEASKRWVPARAGNFSNTQEGPPKKESLRNQTPRKPRNAATSGMPATAG